MDGFYAFIIWTVVTCGAAFSAGRYMPLADVADEVARTGETVIQRTVYQCKPVAQLVRGHRMEIQQ